MSLEVDHWEVESDPWELDQCRYCKGSIEDPTESYCSSVCEQKWLDQHDEQADPSPSSSVFSVNDIHSAQSSQHTTPASSTHSSPAFQPTFPAGSVPNLPLDSFLIPTCERRHSYAIRTHKYGSSHNPIKKSFPSNYYQSTIGDRSGFQPIFADKSVSLGIRKNSVDDIRPRTLPPMDRLDKPSSSSVDKKPTAEPANPTSRHSGLWSWRRLSALM